VTIVVDSSAVLAVLLDEPDAAYFRLKLAQASHAWITPINWWEVQARFYSLLGEIGTAEAMAWMEKMRIRIEPTSADHALEAFTAFRRYSGRPSRLNMGDCFAYALARSKGVPLLYKGNDFAHTDVVRA
jgi:ribonuclease VapC